MHDLKHVLTNSKHLQAGLQRGPVMLHFTGMLSATQPVVRMTDAGKEECDNAAELHCLGYQIGQVAGHHHQGNLIDGACKKSCPHMESEQCLGVH